jgi:hypothetical protein
MTAEFKAYGDANSVMEKVKELRAAGLVQGTDFDFKFMPYRYDPETDTEIDRHATFIFYTEKYATFYILKWS